MGLFFFHFLHGDEREEDTIGIGLASAESAYLEAIATARSMWPELLDNRRDPATCAFEIVDDSGALLFRVDFAELVDGQLPEPVSSAASARLTRALSETHLRASVARSQLTASLSDVRKSLAEANELVARLAAFEKPRSVRTAVTRPE